MLYIGCATVRACGEKQSAYDASESNVPNLQFADSGYHLHLNLILVFVCDKCFNLPARISLLFVCFLN